MKKHLFSLVIIFGFISSCVYTQTDTIKIYTMYFEPAILTISPGHKVVWINKSNDDHTSSSGTNCNKDGKWHSGYISHNQTFSYVFDTVGTFNYFCVPHCFSGMKGIIIVKENETPSKETKEFKKKENDLEMKGALKSSPNFKGLDIINAVTAKTLDKGVLDFTIYHRFGDLTGNNGGSQLFFGLDYIRDIRFAFAYGLTKRILIGLGRSKGDWYNSPYQIVRNLYDGSVKINICTQNSNNNNFSISIYANTVYSAMKSQDIQGSEANFQFFTDRFSHSIQMIASHDFSKYLSLQIMPIYLRRNWVDSHSEITMNEMNLFSLGAGFRWEFSNRIAIIAEYFYTFSDYRKKNKHIFSNPLAIGLEINTGGHIFHINLSNSTGIIPNTFIPYTTSSWLKNGVRLGFSISRKFTLGKKIFYSRYRKKHKLIVQ